MILWLVTPSHLVCRMSYFDFIYTSLEANQMSKKDAFGYDMKHTKMNEWSKKDSSPYNDLREHISLALTYINWNSWPRWFWDVNKEVMELIWIEFESRYFAKLSIYSGYMIKWLNYTDILYTKRFIKSIDILNIWVVMMTC